jgi:hypothetical protein
LWLRESARRRGGHGEPGPTHYPGIVLPRKDDLCPEESKVIYKSKDGKKEKTFDALEWLAAMCSHVPNKGEQMVRYYGYYSKKSRGVRKKAGTDDDVPALIDSDISRQAFRKNWARLIQKIYNVDSLLCTKCLGSMKIVSFIEDSEIVKRSSNI